jgi:hypothetical protein
MRPLAGVMEELRRPGVTPGDRLFRITQRTLRSTRVAPHVDVNRCIIVDLTTPPKIARGFSDLVVRRGEERDLPALCTIDGTPNELARARLARGDLAYVGEIDRDLVCHTWVHRGPTPFDEERRMFALWEVGASAFWSYHGVALPEFRSSGVFAKLFQTVLRELFEIHGARRVQGFIHHTNEPSIAMHARLGFEVLGTVTAIASPTHKWVRWESPGIVRHWLLRRGSDFTLSFPPPA